MKPSWEKTFIDMAYIIARRSDDPSRKVGAVLVKDNKVIGVGYNGCPRNFLLKFDWNNREEKYKYVIHAEMNAIANANSLGINCCGADIYLTLSPCASCIKLLIQHQIRNVYFIEKYTDFEIANEIAKYSTTLTLNQIKYEEM